MSAVDCLEVESPVILYLVVFSMQDVFCQSKWIVGIDLIAMWWR